MPEHPLPDRLFEKWACHMSTRPGATAGALESLQKMVGITLPDDYVAFLRWSNGAEGDIGENFLQISPAEELSAEPYPYAEFVPGLFFFAGDGAEGLFAFDTRVQPMPVVITHTDDLDLDTLVLAAPSFTEFLRLLTTCDWIDYWGDHYGQ